MAEGRRVLVVEDEILIRMLALDMLQELGFEADEAGNAAEAMAFIVAGGAYALAFVDIGLPDRSGDELIRDIRTKDKTLPLVVASGEDPNALKARLGGFAPIAFLGKPYDGQRLRAALAALGAVD